MSNEYERVDLVDDAQHYSQINQYGLVEFKIGKKDNPYVNEIEYEIAQLHARATNSNRDNKNKETKSKGYFT